MIVARSIFAADLWRVALLDFLRLHFCFLRHLIPSFSRIAFIRCSSQSIHHEYTRTLMFHPCTFFAIRFCNPAHSCIAVLRRGILKRSTKSRFHASRRPPINPNEKRAIEPLKAECYPVSVMPGQSTPFFSIFVPGHSAPFYLWTKSRKLRRRALRTGPNSSSFSPRRIPRRPLNQRWQLWPMVPAPFSPASR